MAHDLSEAASLAYYLSSSQLALAEKNRKPRDKLSGHLRQKLYQKYTGPARSFEELCQAFNLVYQRYLEFGYTEENNCKMRFSAHELLPSSQTFVSTCSESVLATATIVPDSEIGLPLSCSYHEQLNLLRSQNRKVAEGTMFSGCKQGQSNDGHLQLIRAAFGWCAQNCIDDFCIVVNPKHTGFWEKMLGFQRLSSETSCPHVCDAPGILLRLDFQHVKSNFSNQPRFARKLFSSAFDQVRLNTDSYQLGEYEVTALLAKYPDILDHATAEQYRQLKACFPNACAIIEKIQFKDQKKLAA